MILFPDAAIEILRQARWSADAERRYELLSGGFAWSDERLGDAAQICVELDSWAFRFVMGYRASLIGNAPRQELKEPWDQLLAQCPEWPGFRPERCDPLLAPELAEAYEKLSDELDNLDRCINKEMQRKRNNAPDACKE